MTSTETTLQKKTTAELMVEISHLDREILYLEHHLLSLYRSAFQNNFKSSPLTDTNSTIQEVNLPQAQELESSSNAISCHSSVNDHSMNTHASISGQRTLADHLGTSVRDHIPETACNISESIIKCVASIFCKLTTRTELLPSSSSSCTCSTILSPEDPSYSSSPKFLYESVQIKLPGQQYDPYKDMIEVTDICIDDGRFEFASKMLKILRSLIGRLEAVDPTKMEDYEQLAFWINIHNSLMMHAFLAYGLHQKQIRKTSSIRRAAYHIGGRSVNICCIQHLILGHALPQFPSSHLSPLFSSAKKQRKGNKKHPFALRRPQPQALFALSMGASSDPSVRMYRAKNVHRELKHAKEEYVQAKVCVQKEKILLPKLLDCYSKEISMEIEEFVETVSCSLQEHEQRAMRQCFQRNGCKCLTYLPFETDLRILVHRDLTK